MLTPDKNVLAEMNRYDKELFVKWNNEEEYFEVWRHMLWGDKIITPVVSNIYNPGKGDSLFCPLDRRIIAWLYSADSQRKGLNKNWQWACDKRFVDIHHNDRIKAKKLFRDIAAEQYGLVNKEIVGAVTDGQDSNEDWIRPDATSIGRTNVLKRTARNAKEYFKDDSA